MRKILLGLIAVLAISTSAVAQTVTGKVTNKVDGQPLAGVSVLVKGTTTGTTTDAGGKFSISAPTGRSLIASFIGFKTKEVPIDSKAFYEISRKKMRLPSER